jgi:stage IV sporulation protein A
MYSGIYEDISKRTNGDIYTGIVGPVRTGKSTFIKKFMELLVIPNIENKYKKERAIDELPQSGSGKSIMTCEPKFVPNEAVTLKINDSTSIKVRLIDCVGYMVEGAIGATEEGIPRMVMTPWSKEAMPFEQAAETGTRKVIEEHSTIGIVVTTDGSFTDIPRASYVKAEERVVDELKEIKKPFVMLLNTTQPKSDETQKLVNELEEKYTIPVIPLDVLEMKVSDIEEILTKVLYEFPVSEITYKIPQWVSNLAKGHWIMEQVEDFVYSSSKGAIIRKILENIKANVCESFEPNVDSISLSDGKIETLVNIDSNVFYKIMSEENNIVLRNESDLFMVLTQLIKEKKSVDMFRSGITAAQMGGYGIVYPDFASLSLEAPEMVSESGKYGIRLKANADALHIINSHITAQVAPIIGSEEECENFFNKVLAQYESNPKQLWDTEIFGRKLSDMMTDNVITKLNSINDDTKNRIAKTINKVSNTKTGGLVLLWL